MEGAEFIPHIGIGSVRGIPQFQTRTGPDHDAAQARTEAAQAQADATEQDVAYETRAAYWRLYRAQARARAMAKSVALIERRLRSSGGSPTFGTNGLPAVPRRPTCSG